VCKGYAWAGGGRRIVRVDITADGGQTWTSVDSLVQDNARSPRHWGWTLWKVLKRPDQGHLHSKLEDPARTDMSRPRIKPGPSQWKGSTLENSHSHSLLIATRNIYIWARDQWRVLATWLLPVHVLHEHAVHEHTWTAIGCIVGSIALARHQQSICQLQRHQHCKSAYSLSNWTDHVGVTTYEDTWPRSSPS